MRDVAIQKWKITISKQSHLFNIAEIVPVDIDKVCLSFYYKTQSALVYFAYPIHTRANMTTVRVTIVTTKFRLSF